MHSLILKTSEIMTPIGKMLIITSETALYLLEFLDNKKLDNKIKHLKQKTGATVVEGITQAGWLVTTELEDYFKGKLKTFTTPVIFLGSSFQNKVWKALSATCFGETISYKDLAISIGTNAAFRAAAGAAGANYCPIIIPCHRVINTSGKLGGYSGGLSRKIWLLNHEKEKK